MRAETISIINQKGGVCKTTTAHSLGAGLTQRGYKVLFIDLDSQMNLTKTLGIDIADKSQYTALHIFMEVITAEEAICRTPIGDLIPSSKALSKANKLLEGEDDAEYLLKKSLEPIKDQYDYIIIDNPPSLSMITIESLTASDSCIIPVQADWYSLEGISDLALTINTLIESSTNPGLKVRGILLTRYNSRTVIGKGMAETLSKAAKKMGSKLFNASIRECTALKESQFTRKDIFSYDSTSNAAHDYNAFINELLEDK